MIHFRSLVLGVFLCGATIAACAQVGPTKTQNVIYVMTDGLRWQEVFNGPDQAIMNEEHGKVKQKDVAALKHAYWRDSRRAFSQAWTEPALDRLAGEVGDEVERRADQAALIGFGLQ